MPRRRVSDIEKIRDSIRDRPPRLSPLWPDLRRGCGSGESALQTSCQTKCRRDITHQLTILFYLSLLLITVMSVGRNHDNNNLCVVNFVNETVFLRDASAPFSWSGKRQRFGFPCATARVFLQFTFQFKKFFECFRILALQALCVFYGLSVVFDSI